MSFISTTLTVPYEKAGLSSEGCCAALRGYTVDVSPEIGTRNRPAVLICPGGGYEYLSDREADYIALRFAAYGIHGFVLRYSICSKLFPTALLEACVAMKYIKSIAAENDIDPNRVAICGFSAGGHLAASLSCYWNSPLITDILGDAESFRPYKAVLGYPVILSEEYSHGGSIYNIVGENPSHEKLHQVSLDKHVSASVPPTFIWHCSDDGCVPVQNTISYINALAQTNICFECHIYPSGGHGGALHDDVTSAYDGHVSAVNSAWFLEAVRFLKS